MRSCSAHIACEDLNLVCQGLRADLLRCIPWQRPWLARACMLQQQGHVRRATQTIGAIALELTVATLQQPYACSIGGLHRTERPYWAMAIFTLTCWWRLEAAPGPLHGLAGAVAKLAKQLIAELGANIRWDLGLRAAIRVRALSMALSYVTRLPTSEEFTGLDAKAACLAALRGQMRSLDDDCGWLVESISLPHVNVIGGEACSQHCRALQQSWEPSNACSESSEASP